MSSQLTIPEGMVETAPETSSSWLKRSGRLEDWLLCISLGLMIVLPLAEVVLRRMIHIGIAGSTAIVQHLGLIVGMIGGAIAARQHRLLALSNVDETLLHGKLRTVARGFSAAVATVITAFLALASYQFVVTEYEAGSTLVYGIPTWAIEIVLPAGFLLVAVRLLWCLPESILTRCMAGIGAVGMIVIAAQGHASYLVIPALAILAVASILGTPAFVSLGGAALILFWAVDQPIASIPVAHYSLVTNPSLPTIPLFTVAGYLLAESGAPRRLVRVFHALLGNVTGGPAIVTVVVCAFFTSFTGASGVTILALGGLLMPVLLSSRYSEKDALGLLTASGSLGLLLPPCLPIILYAIIARIPIQHMFLGGLLPALVLLVATGAWGVWKGRNNRSSVAFSWVEVREAVWDAKWELAIPVITLTALLGGFATPVEAAALTALYAFLIETVIHRDLKFFSDVPRVMTECGLLVGGILLILGVALGFTNYLVDMQVPTRAVEWTTATVHSPLLFLLLLNLFLLVVGCLMDIYSAIVIQVPLLVPIGMAYGIDPVHLGIIFLANLELGYLTPPVGLNLFLSSYRFGKPVPQVLRAVLPLVFVLSLGVLVITYVPALTTALPRWFGR